jgi:hypothetical protein
MPLRTQHVVAAVRTAGFKSFTARKLERWANLGAIPHAQRRGAGRGKGWRFEWPDEALLCALLIADAFTWQKGRRLRDAVLWAWLRNAPVPMPCVRRCLQESYRASHRGLQRELQQGRYPGDEPLDLVDRLAQTLAQRHETLRTARVPKATRLAAMQETIAQVTGQRWPGRGSRAAKNYRRLWGALVDEQRFPWATETREVRRQQAFFQYGHLEGLARTAPDEHWLAARARFAHHFYVTAATMRRVAAGKLVSAAERAEAVGNHQMYNALFQLHPAWVAALMLYPVLKRMRGTMRKRPRGIGRR